MFSKCYTFFNWELLGNMSTYLFYTIFMLTAVTFIIIQYNKIKPHFIISYKLTTWIYRQIYVLGSCYWLKDHLQQKLQNYKILQSKKLCWTTINNSINTVFCCNRSANAACSGDHILHIIVNCRPLPVDKMYNMYSMFSMLGYNLEINVQYV